MIEKPEMNVGLKAYPPLVSIIIPCYNAEQWLVESIESALNQTYLNIEVIVIDDGSTDNTNEILKGYKERIRVEYQSHLGGNHARNHGLSVSKGTYIQFLDADDYFLPQKIEQQAIFLENTGADVVYGDWRYQHHRTDGTIELGEPVFSGVQQDIIESLLDTWWVPCHALLFRRDMVLASSGWDISLRVAQDRDFFIQIALMNADVRYLPGCYTVYRRYGNVTVSTVNQSLRFQDTYKVLRKAEARLAEANRLTAAYRAALAQSYYYIARCLYRLPGNDKSLYVTALHDALSMNPSLRPVRVTTLYLMTYQILGFQAAERQNIFLQRVMVIIQNIMRTLLYRSVGQQNARLIARIYMQYSKYLMTL
jgi:glycosyltransferase involved in cell wall biosynthesis